MTLDRVKAGLIDAQQRFNHYVFETDKPSNNSALHKDMNQWGSTRGVGLVSGVARTVFGAVEFGLAAVCRVVIIPLIMLARAVEDVIRALLGIPQKRPKNRQFGHFYVQTSIHLSHGGHHLRTGLKEALSLGCHQRIARVYQQAKLKIKVHIIRAKMRSQKRGEGSVYV